MSEKKHIVIIGGVAAGTKAASRIVRMDPDAKVTIIEKGILLSYAGCGLPYYVSGQVKDQKDLMATPVGTVRDSVFFQNVKNVNVLNATKAFSIDRENKRIAIGAADDEKPSSWIAYDKLVLCTGATPVKIPINGIDKKGVFSLHSIEDAEGIREQLAKDEAKDVVIVGGGLIGVEMTEALAEHGCRVTIVEMLDNILPMLDGHMARLVEKYMESKGVRVLTGTGVEEILAEGEDPQQVTAVRTSGGNIPADMVIMAVGVRPNVILAKEAGLDIGEKTKAIVVNKQMQTSDPDIYAAGDCVECTNLIDGEKVFVPLGSTANKQGRVAANSVCGLKDSFDGILGSSVCKVFDYTVARTGITQSEAESKGYDVEVVLTPAPDKAHFMPTAAPLLLKLVADKNTRKLLGAQAVGPGDGDKRIDVAAMAIMAGFTIDQLANADLCYAPPYSPAMDNIITACNVMRNKLDGIFESISPADLKKMLDAGEEITLLDCRTPGEYEQMRLAGSTLIPLGTLRERFREIPKNKPVVCFCKISLRGYEGALILKNNGFKDVKVLDGGILMWPYDKES